MKKFVELFTNEVYERYKDDKESMVLGTLSMIKKALKDSDRLIGYKIEFDLESLMVVLQDLASDLDRPMSPPTAAFILSTLNDTEIPVKKYDIKSFRRAFDNDAKKLLEHLQWFIFEKCFEPIRKGQSESDAFSFLDIFYGPLFATIENGIVSNNTSWIFTTNWDLCLKQWLEYARITFEDGTQLDGQRKSVLRPSDGWNDANRTVKVVPLHGCYDLIQCKRFVSRKGYSEIQKLSNPEIYFAGNKPEISKAFIVYPLEAVGYDQTIKSPYLDMLVLLKEELRRETNVFIIGFSFRDSIIASIFDEIIREKSERTQEKFLKILLIDSAPLTVVENLKRQGYVNIANAITPVEVSFPDVLECKLKRNEILTGMQSMIASIFGAMHSAKIDYAQSTIVQSLEQYGLHL